ncbi:MAG: hypothetical protein O3B72_03400, partial [Proteobacteria bacterium]|nr:hypothetical protein [Pseudomonadota bacterium]
EDSVLQKAGLSEIVAKILLEACADSAVQELRCPSTDLFLELKAQAFNDEAYSESVKASVRSRWLRAHRALIGSNSGGAGNSALLRVTSDLRRSFVSDMDSDLASPGREYFSSEVLLASLIHGVNTMNVYESRVGSLEVSFAGVSFLRAFTVSADGGVSTPLFEGVLNRALAATEVSRYGAAPEFLRDRSQWLLEGDIVSFQLGDEDLFDVYLSLMALPVEEAEAL